LQLPDFDNDDGIASSIKKVFGRLSKQLKLPDGAVGGQFDRRPNWESFGEDYSVDRAKFDRNVQQCQDEIELKQYCDLLFKQLSKSAPRGNTLPSSLSSGDSDSEKDDPEQSSPEKLLEEIEKYSEDLIQLSWVSVSYPNALRGPQNIRAYSGDLAPQPDHCTDCRVALARALLGTDPDIVKEMLDGLAETAKAYALLSPVNAVAAASTFFHDQWLSFKGSSNDGTMTVKPSAIDSMMSLMAELERIKNAANGGLETIKKVDEKLNRATMTINTLNKEGSSDAPEAEGPRLHELSVKKLDICESAPTVDALAKQLQEHDDNVERFLKGLEIRQIEKVFPKISGPVGAKNRVDISSATTPKPLSETGESLDDKITHMFGTDGLPTNDELDAAVSEFQGVIAGPASQKFCIEALKKRFQVNVTAEDECIVTKLPKLYAILKKLPLDHITSNMKSITYSMRDGASLYEFAEESGGNGTITPGKITVRELYKESAPYFDPSDANKAIDLDFFTAVTLHEIGHSVDDSFKVMKSRGSQADFGAWQPVSVDDLARKFVDSFWDEYKRPSPEADVSADLVRLAIALLGGRPPANAKSYSTLQSNWDNITSSDAWNSALIAGNPDKAPWQSPSLIIGDDAYHVPYKPGEWTKYSIPQRNAQKISTYQYRAAGEWFAEIYALYHASDENERKSLESKLTQAIITAVA
jgi:hypothetical protein